MIAPDDLICLDVSDSSGLWHKSESYISGHRRSDHRRVTTIRHMYELNTGNVVEHFYKRCSDDPGPPEPKFRLPGLSLAKATNSRKFFIEFFDEPAITNCVETTIVTGTKSFTGSNGSSLYNEDALDSALVCRRIRTVNVRAIAVSSATRLGSYPDVPTMVEFGY